MTWHSGIYLAEILAATARNASNKLGASRKTTCHRLAVCLNHSVPPLLPPPTLFVLVLNWAANDKLNCKQTRQFILLSFNCQRQIADKTKRTLKWDRSENENARENESREALEEKCRVRERERERDRRNVCEWDRLIIVEKLALTNWQCRKWNVSSLVYRINCRNFQLLFACACFAVIIQATYTNGRQEDA